MYECRICGKAEPEVEPRGTGLCNNCWEISSRLRSLNLRAMIFFFYTLRSLVYEKEA